MVKRFLWIGLSLCLILSGCSKNTPSDEPSGTDDGSTQVNTPVGPTLEEVLSTAEWYTVPPYTGSPLIAPDPSRSVYFSLTNQDCDYYPDMWYGSANIYILTREHIDPTEIQVQIPMQTGYSVKVNEYSEECHELACNGTINMGLANYQYLSLRGVDWQQLGQADSDSSEASMLYLDTSLDQSLRQQIYDTYIEPHNERMAAYQAEYEASSAENLPMFYAYNVTVLFNDYYNETVETVTIDLAGESYPIEIGKWRFHAEKPEELNSGKDPEGVNPISECVLAITDNAYHDGYVRLLNALEFTAKQDITLTGLTAEQTEVELLGGKVEYLSGSNAGMDFYWDGKQPLDIPAGAHVSITAYVHDDRFASYEVSCTMLLKMHYEVAEKEQTMTVPCLMARYNNFWDTYLLAFHGYDIGEYYTCYARIMDNSLETMPESWRC